MEGKFPEIPEGGFHDREGLRAWLDGHDEYSRLAISPVLAVRAALRASVFIASGVSAGSSTKQFVISLCRTLVSAWAAINYPSRETLAAARDAVMAASASMSTFAIDDASRLVRDSAVAAARAAAADSADAANTSADAASYAVGFAANAALSTLPDVSGDEKVGAFWWATSGDGHEADSLGSPETLLLRTHLWRHYTPEWWNGQFERLKSAIHEQAPDERARAGWQVWIGWLHCRVDGVPSWQLSEDKAREIEVRIALGDGRENFWDREPDAINSEILGWLSDTSLYDKPERQRRPAIKENTARTQANKKPAPKKKSKSTRDDVPLTISITRKESADETDIPQQESEVQPASKRADLEPLADTVDGSMDHLGRANIAYALAGRINEVWDQMNRPGGRGVPAPGFVIHIDAPWGGGKSTFAEYIAQILNPYAVKGVLPTWLQALPMGKDGTWPERFRRPWHVVRFNAWQHQHVSPPWWVFYDAIRQTCTMATGAEANQRDNDYPQPMADFGYGSPVIQRWKALELRVREYIWRFATPTILINSAFLVAVVLLLWMLTHMGLATFDLEKGFSQGTSAAKTGAAAAGGGLGLIPTLLVTLFGGGAAVWKIVGAFSASLVPGTPDAAKNYSLGSGDPLKRMRKHFAALMEQVHRPVLVIVDDLDRCEPAFVVELVRGMQTILASPRVVYLLLGDRDWIEQSFTEVHKAMKGVEVGPEHRFGGRFVEKAIQFSMVLPDVSEAGRQEYVRQLLTEGRKPDIPAPVTAPPSVLNTAAVPEGQRQIVESLKAEAKEVLETDDYVQRERKAKDLADKFDLIDVDVPREAFNQEMAQKLFFRAATDSTAEKATAHMIEGMASILPANPRQIKRIINTLSLLGQVLRIKDPAKRPGSADWQLLARWVVLMVEWPKSWFTLSRYPGLADVALAIAERKAEVEIAAIEARNSAAGILPPGGMRATAKLLAANKTVMRALDFLESDWEKRPITSSEILWLREVMPAASGQVLQPPQQEKPASADAGPVGKAA